MLSANVLSANVLSANVLSVNVVRRWIVIGGVEVVSSLVLLAIAPIFLNSTVPLIGFLIWLLVTGMLLGSFVYVVFKMIDAAKARQILVARFPDYDYLSAIEFLELSPQVVKQHLAVLEAFRDDPDLQLHDQSPIEILRHAAGQRISR